jgi:hypothetical protein
VLHSYGLGMLRTPMLDPEFYNMSWLDHSSGM